MCKLDARLCDQKRVVAERVPFYAQPQYLYRGRWRALPAIGKLLFLDTGKLTLGSGYAMLRG